MRHLCGYKKLGRATTHREAMFRNMATSLILQEKINTTLPKAKELRSIVEHLITLGKRGDLHSRRLAASYFFDDEAVKKVFSSLAERFKERPGGYTRILRQGLRFGDGAKLATLELLDTPAKGHEEKPKAKQKSSPKTEDKTKVKTKKAKTEEEEVKDRPAKTGAKAKKTEK